MSNGLKLEICGAVVSQVIVHAPVISKVCS